MSDDLRSWYSKNYGEQQTSPEVQSSPIAAPEVVKVATIEVEKQEQGEEKTNKEEVKEDMSIEIALALSGMLKRNIYTLAAGGVDKEKEEKIKLKISEILAKIKKEIFK